MKLSVVIPVMNQNILAKACYLTMYARLQEEDTELIIIDNASDVPLVQADFPGAKIFRNEKNTGVYPTFKQGMELATGDVVAFFHSDVAVWEYSWDTRVLKTFEENSSLGLLGFIGSNEIDPAGGRGLGTASNFMGKEFLFEGYKWTGSTAETHGKRLTGYMRGAVVDGCTMILRRRAWEDISPDKDMAPHHFYDKLISCQILEMGWGVGILGIEFDHFSGQTVNQEQKYQDDMKEWCDARGIPMTEHNWDATVYKYSEEKWLKEYRDEKHLIPCKI